MMYYRLKKILLPTNSRRRLFCDLIARAVAQPRDFFRYVNLSSFRYFLNYFRNADPELVGRMVDEVLARDRAQAGEAARINHHFLKVVTGKADTPAPPRLETVDIIIPVYNAFELTQACIASVLEHSDNCRLILVDDSSQDERIRPLLESVAGIPERQIEVLVHHNERNLGFVQTINFAFRLTANHFVILNSDTEVPPVWLDRLFAPIFADPARVASVTPFSNAGMACSFPVPDCDNSLFNGMSVTELDAFFSRYGGVEPVELFGGVGFCMAFNRKVVERIGLFDAATFGKGYGEETDWSLRAHDAGYRNLLTPNLFVWHKHGGSFGAEEKARLQENNVDRLWKRHGRHMARLREMTAADHLRPIRETVAFMAVSGAVNLAQRVAIIDVDLSGGGTIYSARLAKWLADAGIGVVHLRFNHRQGYLKLQAVNGAEQRDIVMPREGAAHLPELMRAFRVTNVIVNQLTSWPEPLTVMDWLVALGLPYLVMAHDFFALCPSWFLVDRQGRFCGVPDDMEVCAACMLSNDASLHREFYRHALDDLGAWRRTAGRFLDRAERVICFSNSTADHFRRAYPGCVNLEVVEHAIPNRERFVWKERRLDAGARLNLAIIGHLFPAKGERVIKEMIESQKFRSLPVSLTVFGESPLYPPGHVSPDGQVSFLGSYLQEGLPELLEKHGIHVVVVASILPETFSYTTSEAILMGYPVICFNLGAQAERVKKYGCGLVIADVSCEALLAGIEQLIKHPERIKELSRNCRFYAPPTSEEHFSMIVELLYGKRLAGN